MFHVPPKLNRATRCHCSEWISHTHRVFSAFRNARKIMWGHTYAYWHYFYWPRTTSHWTLDGTACAEDILFYRDWMTMEKKKTTKNDDRRNGKCVISLSCVRPLVTSFLRRNTENLELNWHLFMFEHIENWMLSFVSCLLPHCFVFWPCYSAHSRFIAKIFDE